MSSRIAKRLAFWSALWGLAFPAACGSSGVVGGDCAASYVSCDGRCVDTENDPRHCGGCEHACDPGVACHHAICKGKLDDGSAGDTNGGDSGSNGHNGDSGDGNGASSGDAGASGFGASSGHGTAGFSGSSKGGESGENGETGESGESGEGGDKSDDLDAGDPSDAKPDANASCLPPYKFPEACGNCATQCTAEAPNCAPGVMGGYKCVVSCMPPLKPCSGQCVDYNVDAENCGSCGNVCPSRICQGGKCVGANVGHVVLACMDYQQPAKNTGQTALMGNAVLLPLRNPVRILAYTEYAPTTERARVDQDIGYAAQARGRTYTTTPLAKYTSASATLNIGTYDVFLIYDQTAAPAGQLATIGAAWQKNSVVDSFAAAGGVVIVLSGGTSEMGKFLTASELLEVSSQTVVNNTFLYNRAPADALGINVISPFLAPVDSCTFGTARTPDSDTVFVVSDGTAQVPGSPVVIHRVILP